MAALVLMCVENTEQPAYPHILIITLTSTNTCSGIQLSLERNSVYTFQIAVMQFGCDCL